MASTPVLQADGAMRRQATVTQQKAGLMSETSKPVILLVCEIMKALAGFACLEKLRGPDGLCDGPPKTWNIK